MKRILRTAPNGKRREEAEAVAACNGPTSQHLSYGKGKAFPLQTWTGPWEFQEVEAPEFLDNRHMQVVSICLVRL